MSPVDARLHVLIQDAAQQVYQVPESVLPRPSSGFETNGENHELEFDYVGKFPVFEACI